MMSLRQAEKIYTRANRRFRRHLMATMSASLRGEGWRGVLGAPFEAMSKASKQLNHVSARYIAEGKREPLQEVPF